MRRYSVSPTCLKCPPLTVLELNITSTVSPPTNCCVPRLSYSRRSSPTGQPAPRPPVHIASSVDDRWWSRTSSTQWHHCASALADSFYIQRGQHAAGSAHPWTNTSIKDIFRGVSDCLVSVGRQRRRAACMWRCDAFNTAVVCRYPASQSSSLCRLFIANIISR